MNRLPDYFARCENTQAHYAYLKAKRLIDSGMAIKMLGDELDTPLYAWCGLNESDEFITKSFKRDPVVSWRFHVPGQDNTSIIIKPAYRKITDKERNEQDNEIYRTWHTGSHIFDWRQDILLLQPGVTSQGFVDFTDYYLAIKGDQDTAKIVSDFYYAFDADQLAIFALESERCCFCRKPLTDAKSRARGVGPDCFRGWETLIKIGGAL
jgi:hypothetical protein